MNKNLQQIIGSQQVHKGLIDDWFSWRVWAVQAAAAAVFTAAAAYAAVNSLKIQNKNYYFSMILMKAIKKNDWFR